MSNKYGARRTWSNLWQRWFASKAEHDRATDLFLLQTAGEISNLEFQPKFILCDKPKITYSADFKYLEGNKIVVEDVKGVLTRECRIKIAWIKEKFDIEVRLVR